MGIYLTKPSDICPNRHLRQQPHAEIHAGAPAHSDSQLALHVLGDPLDPPDAAPGPFEQRPSDTCSQTVDSVCCCSICDASSQLAATPTGQSMPSWHAHSMSSVAFFPTTR